MLKHSLVAVSILLTQSFALADNGASAQWLTQQLQGRKVVCVDQTNKAVFTISVSPSGVHATAKGEPRGARYNADHSSMTTGQFFVTLVNNIDGPLAQDLLIFENQSLVGLGNRSLSEIFALDVASEGYDGTTQKHRLVCHGGD